MQSSSFQVDKEFGTIKSDSLESSGALKLRHAAASGMVKTQSAPTAYAVTTTLTIADLLTGIVRHSGTGAVTWTLPTATLAVAGVSGVKVGDSIDFSVINDATTTATIVTLASAGTAAIVGYALVQPRIATALNTGSGLFRLRFDDVDGTGNDYTVYRLS